MANLNKVFLIGNLTRDPQLKYTPGGTAVAELGLATNRSYRNSAGEMVEEATFVDITVWGRQGETANQYLAKGRSVFIEGRLQLDQWEDQQSGQKRSKLRVVADRVQFLGGRGEGGGGGGGGQQGGGYQGGQQRSQQPPRQPSAPPQPSEPQVQDGPADTDFNLDDIPF